MYRVKEELPNSSLPKQGEGVTWYSHSRRMVGELRGYDSMNRPLVISKNGIPDSTNDIFSIRPLTPTQRIEPNWTRLPEGGRVETPEPGLELAIQAKLAERMPPGPSYADLMREMYFRGYETYLVGGTVRDFIQGADSNDIDMVTTMPLKSALSLLRSMYFRNYHPNLKKGYVRLGGTPSSGEPFVDIKNFWLGHSGPGFVFGSEIIDDYTARDFACNAIYYDPVNSQLIDPSGIGINDASTKTLTIVKDLDANPPKIVAELVFRFVKFSLRGYSCSVETMIQMKQTICPTLASMTAAERERFLVRQIINKVPPEQRAEQLQLFKSKMHELELNDAYESFIEPLEGAIIV